MYLMMDSIVAAGFARHSHEMPAQIGKSPSSLKIMPQWAYQYQYLAATAPEKPKVELKPIESLIAIQIGAHSVGSEDAEEETAFAESAVVAAVPEPTVVDETILQVMQTEAQFVYEVTVPTESGPGQIEEEADIAGAAAQPVLECGAIHFDSHFDRKMSVGCWCCWQHCFDSTAEEVEVADDEEHYWHWNC